jgi:hypothetical protein
MNSMDRGDEFPKNFHRGPPESYSPECMERLSEKGYEQHSECGFGRRKVAKMGLTVLLRAFVRIHRKLLRPFSDSLGRGILRSSLAGSCIENAPRATRSASKRLHDV